MVGEWVPWPTTLVGQWVRRVYDDRRYVDGARHLVVGQGPTGVTTRCGPWMALVTPAKVPNRLVPSPEAMIRSDTRTCKGCQRA